ncbi:MAG: hypothetical protein Unbinned2903contig1001_20 [Prokaryotic dsDNA virus sp.]|nr:MAG: hypothetical protein Unbinned2903contig1001_20 [Prokaryotic dsDNA virus sp.]|tara:strand:+ start:10325 stop:10837 length:513 start_codon:yes stop_codon:yes gene_type:complete
MSIIQTSNFTGKYALPQGMYVSNNISNYITIYEGKYLRELLGVDLYNLFEADLILGVTQPTEPRFLVIWDQLNFDYSNMVYRSEGFHQMLKGFIYFEYLKDSINEITPIGNVKPIGENSQTVNTLGSTMYGRYNDAIKSYNTIQKYIQVNPLDYDYSDFNGVHKSYNYWL